MLVSAVQLAEASVEVWVLASAVGAHKYPLHRKGVIWDGRNVVNSEESVPER